MNEKFFFLSWPFVYLPLNPSERLETLIKSRLRKDFFSFGWPFVYSSIKLFWEATNFEKEQSKKSFLLLDHHFVHSPIKYYGETMNFNKKLSTKIFLVLGWPFVYSLIKSWREVRNFKKESSTKGFHSFVAPSTILHKGRLKTHRLFIKILFLTLRRFFVDSSFTLYEGPRERGKGPKKSKRDEGLTKGYVVSKKGIISFLAFRCTFRRCSFSTGGWQNRFPPRVPKIM